MTDDRRSLRRSSDGQDGEAGGGDRGGRPAEAAEDSRVAEGAAPEDGGPIDRGRRALLTSAGMALPASCAPALGAGGAPGASPPPARGESVANLRFTATRQVRVGVVGVGDRGSFLLKLLLGLDGVAVRSVCDVVKEKAARAASAVQQAGQPAPAVFAAGERDFENLCRRDDVDLVVIATPWEWHVPMAVAAMEAGHHAAVEVPAAVTLPECWRLVDTSERTRRHCVMLENCCYGRNELLVLQLVRAGRLGEILHGEAAYIHDLRKILFAKESEGLWRRAWHTRRDGNLYPTHGLGPVARYMEINRGDRFERLVSMSSASRGLQIHRDKLPADDPRRRESYLCGDMNTSLLRTARGRTIVLQHDVVSPRPYDRINMVSGTKGAFRDYPPRIFLDGQEAAHDWQSIDPLAAEYEHPLWRETGELARTRGGHGGMDFVMLYRLIQCMREGQVPDMDVYDAAAWSAPGPLADASVAQSSAPQPFPDFTRGRWQEKRG
jgi:hypothetical protein